jgi:hypothetical protein
MIVPIDERLIYVQFNPALLRIARESLPSNRGLESATNTLNFLPFLCASNSRFKTTDDLYTTLKVSSII